jgi:outer membrane lipoprotein SlyB
MSAVLTGLVLSAMMIAVGVWGRRNAHELTPRTYTAYSRARKARQLRFGANCLIGMAALTLLLVAAYVVRTVLF